MFIMLRTPHGRLAVQDNLRFEDTFHTLIEGGAGTVANAVGNIYVGSFLLVYLTQQLHNVYHCIVVVSDMSIITLGTGPELRPATVGILGFENIPDTIQSGIFVLFGISGQIQAGEVFDFRTGCIVVYRTFVYIILGGEYVFTFLLCQFGRHIDVFGPTAGGLLIKQYIVANADGLSCFKEFIVQFRSHFHPGFIGLLLFVVYVLLCKYICQA